MENIQYSNVFLAMAAAASEDGSLKRTMCAELRNFFRNGNMQSHRIKIQWESPQCSALQSVKRLRDLFELIGFEPNVVVAHCRDRGIAQNRRTAFTPAKANRM